jgi:hypothetical protein
MSGAGSKYGGEEKYVQISRRKSWKKDTTWGT